MHPLNPIEMLLNVYIILGITYVFTIESFSPEIGVVSTYSSPLLCSSRFYHCFWIWFLLCLFIGILYLLLLLENPHLPLYIILIIVCV